LAIVLNRQLKAVLCTLTVLTAACRCRLGYDPDSAFLSFMDKSALVKALIMSEKNRSTVTIKVINTEKPVVGAVQKVLNQIIILKSVASEPVTLTFGDIESVDGLSDSLFTRLCQNLFKTLHRRLRIS
jgi:hypothetical protein